jgi:hypothetical protein
LLAGIDVESAARALKQGGIEKAWNMKNGGP